MDFESLREVLEALLAVDSLASEEDIASGEVGSKRVQCNETASEDDERKVDPDAGTSPQVGS